MEYLAGIGILAWAVLMVVVVCVSIAPLIIWRNTNRANRILEELLEETRRSNRLLGELERRQAAEKHDFELS
ncbi:MULTISPECIES: hypothetical protein [Desulfovibrio]|jgi:ABC-type bacteriocin/lantibiotic exporter with double-glycine peptidase domain|uniref:hypothetical protein n=1 Tax=Desulfovibrio TaxID=872 RepID=UPI000408F778|nr:MULTISPECIES: hypothetical protein [Desulfovibrio]MDY0307515.1 hypothetical protein [Desulfovibrionaceae bacterium]HMM39662.1 hypothetical protein [Desulfovibrio sp.]